MRLIAMTTLLGIGLLGCVTASCAAQDSVVAARVALLALRASALGTHGPVDRYIMLPSLGALEEDQVIKVLTALWKPAECSAWQEGTTMWLTCWSRDQIPDQSLLDGVTGLAKSDIAHVKAGFPGKTSLKIIVQDSVSRITITDAQLELFLSDYFVVPASHSMRTDNAPSNVDAVVTFHRSTLGRKSGQ
jgi:hypothetical protein